MHTYPKVYPTYGARCCLSGCFTAVGPGTGTAAAAMQWQSQVSPLILTVSCCLIHCSAFRTLAYIYKQLTLPVLLHPSPIPLVFLLGSEMRGCSRNHTLKSNSEQRIIELHEWHSACLPHTNILLDIPQTIMLLSFWTGVSQQSDWDLCSIWGSSLRPFMTSCQA